MQWQLWFSLVVLFLHTVDESQGEIWEYLSAPRFLYFAFQLGVMCLTLYAFGEESRFWWAICASHRCFDAIFTHAILPSFIPGENPGFSTMPFLLLDAVFLADLSFG